MPHYPPPNNPEVCKVTLLFNRDTRILVNTFHVQKTGGWSLADLNNLHTVVLGWFNTYYKPVIPAIAALFQISYRVYSLVAPLALDAPVSPAVPGTRPGTPEAGNATATLSERTGLAGRAHRGRMFVPALSESDVGSDDRLGSTLQAAMSTAISQLITQIFTYGAKLVIFHRPGLVPKPLDNLVDQVLSYVIQNLVDSQRKRLPGRGR